MVRTLAVDTALQASPSKLYSFANPIIKEKVKWTVCLVWQKQNKLFIQLLELLVLWKQAFKKLNNFAFNKLAEQVKWTITRVEKCSNTGNNVPLSMCIVQIRCSSVNVLVFLVLAAQMTV